MQRSTEHHPSRVRRHRRLAPLVLVALALAACGSDDKSSSGTTAADDTTSVGAAETTAPAESAPSDTAASSDDPAVVIGAVLEPTSLDLVTTAGAALDQVLLDNVYETLLKADDSGAIEPGLSALPEISADGTEYTLVLQDGVTFHDGAPLTADDVVWSLDAFRAEGATGVDDLAAVSSVEAVDDSTVKVTLTQPDNDLLFNLTRRAGAVLEHDATGLADSANGTGPFTLGEWNVGTSISLARNDSYWAEEPKVSEVTFVYFTDSNAAVNALTTGDVDVLTGVSSDLVGPLQDDDEFVVNQGTTNGEFTLGFNNARPGLDNVKVRTAIRQAIDKQGILDLSNGFGTLIGGPVPPTDPWFEDLSGLVPYDPAAAKAALAEAGFESGLTLEFVYPNIYSASIAEYVVSQLAEVGITVNVTTVEFSVWLDQVYGSKDYDLTAVLHVEPRDIGNYGKDYYWNYDNPQVRQLIADAKVAPSQDEATALLKQATEQIAADSPVDWLLLWADLTVSKKTVTGYPINDTASRFDASKIVVEG